MEQRETIQDSTRLHLPRWDELPDISLYMDQVLSLINPHFQDTYGDSYLLTSTMVNNYVKLGVRQGGHLTAFRNCHAQVDI